MTAGNYCLVNFTGKILNRLFFAKRTVCSHHWHCAESRRMTVTKDTSRAIASLIRQGTALDSSSRIVS